MSFVSGLFGGNAQSAQIDKGATTDQAKAVYDQQQQAIQQQQSFAQAVAGQNGLQNQNSVYQQLAGIANGTGPSVAQNQLAQATGANVANQAALAAGQRGASQNAGLIARQAAMAGTNAQQQGAGQMATLRAQEQQNAIGQMGQLSTNQVGQQQAALANLSGATNSAQSNILNGINAQNSSNVAMQSNVNTVNQQAASAAMGAAMKIGGGIASGGATAMMAHGGMVPDHGRFVDAHNRLHGIKAEPKMMADGGSVPGQAAMAGDNLKNDTQVTKLSPGEVVIPRSVMMSKDPLAAATAFLKQVMEGKGPKPQVAGDKQALNSGGSVIEDLEKNQRSTPNNPDYTYTPTENDYRADALRSAGGALVPDFVSKTADAIMAPPDLGKISQAAAGDAARDSGMGGQQDNGASGSWDAPQQPMSQHAGDPNAATPGGAPGTPQGSQDPYGYGAMTDNTMAGYGKQVAGLNMQADAEGKKAQAESAAANEQVKSAQNMQANFQQEYQKLDQDRKGFQQALMSGKIDPDHYINNRSDGQKVSQTIGLILGGLGGGMLGTENPALAFLNKQIDRDIDAQKADMGKNENLLKQNMQQFGNLHDATTATRAMLADVYAAKLTKAGADSGSEAAKARAMQASGELQMKVAPMMQQMAMRKAMMTSNSDPSMKIRMMVPEGQQQAMFKELGEAQGMVKTRDNLLSAFEKVNKISTLGNAITNPIQSGRQRDAIINPLLAQLSKDSAGRFTEADADYLRSLFTARGDNDKTVQLKRQQINSFVSAKMHFPGLNAYGIDPVGGGRFDPHGQDKIQQRKLGGN